MKFFLWLALFIGVLVPSTRAGSAPLSDDEIKIAVSRLAEVIAEDVPGDAKWTAVGSGGQSFGILTQQRDAFPAEGNAFRFAEKAGESTRIVMVSSGQSFEVLAESKTARDDDTNPQVREFRANWKDADLAKDVAAAITWLEKETKKVKAMKPSDHDQPADPFAPSYGGRGNEAGNLLACQISALLWAGVIHRTGHPDEAVVVARAALSEADAEKRKQMLDGLFHRLANSAFETAMRDFAKSHDWNRLHSALTKAVQRFPEGWQGRDGVRVMIEHVSARAKLGENPPFQTKTQLLVEDQKQIADWLARMRKGKGIDYIRWTLPATGDAEDEQPVNDEAATFPRSRGLAAVPLLAALLDDATLEPISLRGWGATGYFGGHSEDKPEALRQQYRNLSRPATRAEIAWQTLERVLPSDMNRGRSDAPSEKADDVMSWYRSVKDLTQPDLALAYLESGVNEPQVLAHALKTTDSKKLARLENRMIENANSYDLQRYSGVVEKLGPRAPGFIAKLRQKLEADLARFSNEDTEQKKMIDSGLKRLEAIVKGEKKKLDLPGALALVSKFDPAAQDMSEREEMQEAWQSLDKEARKLKRSQWLEQVLPVLPSFKSPAVAANMLNFRPRGNPKSEEKEDPTTLKALIEKTKVHWSRLLEQKQETDEEGAEDDDSGGDGKLLVQVVFTLRFLAGENPDPAVNYLGAMGPRGDKVLREIGRALVEGQKPPPLPDVSADTTEARKKMLADWNGKSGDELAKAIDALDVAQLIVLNEALTREPDLPEGLKTHLQTIHELKVSGGDASKWQAFKGRKVDRAAVVDLAKRISEAGGGKQRLFALKRTVPVFGWSLTVREGDSLKGTDWFAQEVSRTGKDVGESLPKLAKRLCVGFCRQRDAFANWSWFDAPITEAPKDDAAAEPKKPESEDLAEAFEQLQQMRSRETEGWETVTRAFEATSPEPSNLFFFSVASESLVEKKK